MIILYLTSTISHPNLIAELDKYGSLSIFKINYSKSEILNVSVSEMAAESLHSSFQFNWATITTWVSTYRNVCVTSLTLILYPCKKNITVDLLCWDSDIFTWFGRNNILKINILLKRLYLSQALTIDLPALSFRILSIFKISVV